MPGKVNNGVMNYWLADGFHHTHAARRAEIKSPSVDIHGGTKRDAILYSVGGEFGAWAAADER